MLSVQQESDLRVMLAELVVIQDDATHCNEAGEKFAAETRQAIMRRKSKQEQIIAYCNSLVEK